MLTVDNLQYDEDLMMAAMILFFAFNYNSWSVTFWIAPALIFIPYMVQISQFQNLRFHPYTGQELTEADQKQFVAYRALQMLCFIALCLVKHYN